MKRPPEVKFEDTVTCRVCNKTARTSYSCTYEALVTVETTRISCKSCGYLYNSSCSYGSRD